MLMVHEHDLLGQDDNVGSLRCFQIVNEDVTMFIYSLPTLRGI
jgi:hypothetical protein